MVYNIYRKTCVVVYFKISLEAAINKYSSKQLFLKILQLSQESISVGGFFNKVAGPQNCNFIKKRLLSNLRSFQEYLILLNISSDCFWQFQVSNLQLYLKILKDVFRQNTSGWLLLKFICEL